jgi:hypothetical protein
MSRIRASLSVCVAASAASLVPAAAAEPDASQKSAFEVAMTEADRRFVAGDSSGALELLEPVCAGTERADCSFSLGAVHHALGHCSEALAYYRHYRAVAPRGEHFGEVTAALEEVESRCGDIVAPVLPAAPVATPPAVAPASSGALLGPVPGAPARGPAVTGEPPASSNTGLVVGAFAVSGAAAATSVVFGILAARSARRCDRARAYDRDYVQECEVDGPRYQGLWQGFALASGGFLGVGLTLWWLDVGSSSASLGVSGAGYPELNYRRTF